MEFQRGKNWPKKYRKKWARKHPSVWNLFGRKSWRNIFGPQGRRCGFEGRRGPGLAGFENRFRPGFPVFEGPTRCPEFEVPPRRPEGRHHGKKDAETERPASAEAGDGFMAAREQSAEFLRYVGQTVAAFLDPLGIDVSVDVEHGQNPSGSTKNQQTEAPKSKEGDVEMTPPTPQEVDLRTPPPSPSQQQRSSSTPPKQASPPPSSKDSETGDGDWTMVQEGTPASAGPSESQAETRNGMETEESVAAPIPPSEPLHPIPRIAEAVERMLTMGFSNDGGWLSRLVEAKDGNIGAVLDTLHPLHSRQPHH